jgi:hypothetical protein
MIRNIASRINLLFAERSHPVRVKCSVPLKVTFEAVRSTTKVPTPTMPVFLTGETHDCSCSGVAFVVSSIRVMENYLVGQDRVLVAELDLPDGKVKMKVIGRRYEQIGMHLSTEKYLVGAEIIEISDADREAYEHFLKYGNTRSKAAAQMQLGID